MVPFKKQFIISTFFATILGYSQILLVTRYKMNYFFLRINLNSIEKDKIKKNFYILIFISKSLKQEF
jgi:hypothetical protein